MRAEKAGAAGYDRAFLVHRCVRERRRLAAVRDRAAPATSVFSEPLLERHPGATPRGLRCNK
jgi:hypothetical protein